MVWSLGAVALVVAVAANVGSAWRIASWVVPSGAERALAAAVIGASLIVTQALALGLVGWGTSPLPVVVTTLVTLAATRLVLPAPAISVGADVAGWIHRTPGAAAGGGATLGVAVGWLGWTWHRPFVGYDGMLQNLLEIVAWVHDGRPGSQHRVLGLAPVEAFPLTNDVALAWFAGLARTAAVVPVWTIGGAVLLVAATATVLDRAGVRPVHRWLAVAALVTVPHVAAQLNSPKTDVAALAWLVTAAALVQAVPRYPRAVVVAIAACGLSIGAKTTTLPLVGLIVVVAMWRARSRPVLIAAGALAAAVVGGIWYIRNLVLHGSPLWPFVAAPWGDPVAPIYEHGGSTFSQDPVATVEGQIEDWARVAAGGLALATGALLAGLVWGDRRIRLLVGAGAVALVVWAVTPVTGVDNANLASDVLTSTTRYLLPVMALGAVVAALVAERGGSGGAVSRALLVASLLGNLVAVAAQGTPVMAPLPLVGATAALVALAADQAVRRHRVPSGIRLQAALGGALVLVAAGVAVSADGWTSRHREALRFGGEPIELVLESERFVEGDHPVVMSNVAWSDLAGDRLAHEVRLLEPGVSCERLAQLRRSAWVILVTGSFLGPPDLPLERGCLAGAEPFAADDQTVVFAPLDR